MFLGISNFLEEISSFPFYCFHPFLCIDHWGRLSCLSLLFLGTLCSDGYIFLFLCLSLLFFSQLFVRPPQRTILPFSISFSWGWSWSLPPIQCHKPPSIVLQALCLSDLILWIYFSLPLWFRSYLNGLVVFPTFFSLSLNFAIRSSEAQATLSLVFTDCIELLHLWLQRI